MKISETDKIVSIHAPAWGATNYTKQTCRPETVSIHAPAWGATLGITSRIVLKQVSIHAPAWGATIIAKKDLLFVLSFNPRPRMGGDRNTRQEKGSG